MRDTERIPLDALQEIAELRRELRDLRATALNRIHTLGARLISGSGTPEGSVAAPIGTLFTRTDGGASTTLYVKESGTGNTGWVAK